MECSKIVKKIAFEKAISVDRPEKTLAEMYQQIESISIEDDYDGPKLENETTVTLDFMKKLMQWYKDQKKLHKKYAYKVNTHTRILFIPWRNLFLDPLWYRRISKETAFTCWR